MDVDEVQIEAVHRGDKLRQPVERRFGRPPVVVVHPILDELLQVVEVRAVGPTAAGDFPRKTCARKAVAQILQHGFGNVDVEGAHTAGGLRGHREPPEDARIVLPVRLYSRPEVHDYDSGRQVLHKAGNRKDDP